MNLFQIWVMKELYVRNKAKLEQAYKNNNEVTLGELIEDVKDLLKEKKEQKDFEKLINSPDITLETLMSLYEDAVYEEEFYRGKPKEITNAPMFKKYIEEIKQETDPLKLQEYAYKYPSMKIQYAILNNPNTSLKTIEYIKETEGKIERILIPNKDYKLALNNNIEAQKYLNILKTSDNIEDIKKVYEEYPIFKYSTDLLKNPNLTLEMLILYNNKTKGIYFNEITENIPNKELIIEEIKQETDPKKLIEYSKISIDSISLTIMQNPNITKEVIDVLYKYSSSEVREEIIDFIENKKVFDFIKTETNKEKLIEYINSSLPYYKPSLLENPNLDLELMEKLYDKCKYPTNDIALQVKETLEKKLREIYYEKGKKEIEENPFNFTTINTSFLSFKQLEEFKNKVISQLMESPLITEHFLSKLELEKEDSLMFQDVLNRKQHSLKDLLVIENPNTTVEELLNLSQFNKSIISGTLEQVTKSIYDKKLKEIYPEYCENKIKENPFNFIELNQYYLSEENKENLRQLTIKTISENPIMCEIINIEDLQKETEIYYFSRALKIYEPIVEEFKIKIIQKTNKEELENENKIQLIK